MNGYTQPSQIRRSGRGQAHTQSGRHSRRSARPRSSNPATQLQKQSHNLRKFAGREGGKRRLNHGDTQAAARAPAQVTKPLNFKNSHTTFANSQVRKGASALSTLLTFKTQRAPPLNEPSHSPFKTVTQPQQIRRSGRGQAQTQSRRHSSCCARPRSSNQATQLQKQSHNLRKFAGQEGGKRTLNSANIQDAARAPAQ